MSIYWEGDGIRLFLGDCREETAWLDADVLVTDPPYGRNWSIPAGKAHASGGARSAKEPIANDISTDMRDHALKMWGASKPAICFGDLMLPPPARTKRVLVYKKPPDAGIIGSEERYCEIAARRLDQGVLDFGDAS